MATAPGTQTPKSIAELKSLIVSGKITLPGKPAALAKAMLEQPECVAFESAGSVAQRCGVSPATAHRLPRLLGFRSFRDLRLLFQDELRRQAAGSV